MKILFVNFLSFRGLRIHAHISVIDYIITNNALAIVDIGSLQKMKQVLEPRKLKIQGTDSARIVLALAFST